MRVDTIWVRLALVIAAVADLLLFSLASGITLIAMAIGTATVFMGVIYSYRQASVAGVLIICSAAASAIDIQTLTEFGTLETAAFGLVIPVMVLMLVALSAEREEAVSAGIRRGPVIRVAAYLLACLFTVPMTVLLISFVAPEASTMISIMAEAAILLVVTLAAVMILTWREPRAGRAMPEK